MTNVANLPFHVCRLLELQHYRIFFPVEATSKLSNHEGNEGLADALMQEVITPDEDTVVVIVSP